MTRKTDERGAYAVLFGLLAIVLMGIAALAVDIGDAVARKSDVQAQADFAALAAARELTSTSGTVPAAAVNAARDYINNNSPQNKDCAPDCVTSAQLTNTVLTDGEVRFANGGLQVITPQEHVDFGLARVIGFDDTEVDADATVGIFSPGTGPMPMYAASGCDYGPQTLTDPASGHVETAPTNLFNPPGGTNDTTVTAIYTPSPASIPVASPAAPGPMLGVNGTKFFKAASGPNPADRVTKIGFFLNDGATWHSQDTTAADWTALTNNATSVRVASIPAAVAAHEGVWWVRVFKKADGDPDTAGSWSAEEDAEPLQVGSSELECDAGSHSGNFGTLRLPRDDVAPALNLPMNIATTLDEPLSLAKHANSTGTGLCQGAVGAIESSENGNLFEGTNCVATDPGLPANDATQGLVTGVGSQHGRLNAADNPTNSDCGRSDRELDIGSPKPRVNNDTLTCFLTDAGNLSSIMSPSYAGDARLSDDIFDSPRFFWLPVLAIEPTSGASNRYWIVDFRPGFITDETATATKAVTNATADNGLFVHANKIEQVKVVFFHWKALPGTTDGPVTDYLGIGNPILRLID